MHVAHLDVDAGIVQNFGARYTDTFVALKSGDVLAVRHDLVLLGLVAPGMLTAGFVV